MGYGVIQQPDGKFCIASSYSDSMAMWNATEDEVVTFLLQDSMASAYRSARQAIDRATGVLPPYPLVPSYEEAVADHNERYPDDRIEPVAPIYIHFNGQPCEDGVICYPAYRCAGCP